MTKPVEMSASEFRKARGLPVKAGANEFGDGGDAMVTMPPTVNHAYFTGSHGRRVLSSEGKKYKAQVREMFQHLNGTVNKPVWLTLRIKLFLPLHFKNGKVRAFDASNRIKLLEDAVCEAIGIDDKHIRLLIVEKFENDLESAVVSIEPWAITNVNPETK